MTNFDKLEIKLRLIALRAARLEALRQRDFVQAVKLLQEIVRLRKLILPMLILIFTVACGQKQGPASSQGGSATPASLPCGNAVCAGNGYDPRAFTRSKGTVIHFFGDSIHMGWGFHTYDYPSVLNRIDHTANAIFNAEGLDIEMRRAASQNTDTIWNDISTGIIQTQDKVLFENAGPHYNNTAMYRAWIELAVESSLRKDGSIVRAPSDFIITTMFDYSPTIPFATYDEIVDSGKSMNDVVSEVAAAKGTALLDWNTQMDTLDAILRPQGILLVKDTVHPTPWGNIVLAMSIAKHMGATLSDLGDIVDELMLQMDVMVLKGFNPAMSEQQVVDTLNTIKGVL